MARSLERLCAAMCSAAISIAFVSGCSTQDFQVSPSDIAGLSQPPTAVDQIKSPEPAERTEADALQIAIIGDSFTSGTHYGGWGSKNWTNLLGHELAVAGYDVYMQRSARGGAGYRHVGPSGTTYGSEAARDINSDTKMVVFFGSDSDADSIDGLYGAVVNTINIAKEAAPHAPILVVGPGWCRSETPSPSILATRNAVRDAAHTTGVMFVDPIGDNWFDRNPTNIAPDGVHPTDAGHAIIAERLLGPFLDSLWSVQPPKTP